MEVRTPVRPSFLKKLLSVFLSFAMVLCYFVVVPVQEAKAESANYTQTLALGGYHSAAIMTDGTLWTWGYNCYGQLGDNSTTNRYTPVKVMDNVAAVSLGDGFSAAIMTDGTLWTWGLNLHGQLGDGTTTIREEPVKVMDNVAAVSLGGYHSAAITTDGSLWMWGKNNHGQLGDNSTTDRYTPVKVMDDVISVDLGNHFSAAITANGSLWTWGSNYYGQLGDNSTTDHYTPVKVMDNVAAVSLGGSHSAAIMTDGTLWTWGFNGSGELGDGTYSDCYTPERVMEGALAVSMGESHSAAIMTDGTLWTWGWNYYGRLGDGTAMDRNTPVKVMDNVAAVSLGGSHSAAIMTDGTLWTWGRNNYGRLGDGTTKERNRPVKVLNEVMLPGSFSSGGSNESQLPVNISGTFNLALQATQKNGKSTISCKWDDGWFSKSSGAMLYNHDLATTASVLSSAVYKENYIEEDLEKLGFDNSKYGYVSYYPNDLSAYHDDFDQVGYEIAAKDIAVDGKAVQLLFVGVRGTPGNMEWDSNANVMDSSLVFAPNLHEGFQSAQELVLSAVNAYASRHSIDLSTARVLVTGHSRGAAVANLLGKSLDDGRLSNETGTMAAGRAYVFTFASPNVTKSSEDKTKGYSNIYNIVNPEDIVTRVPLKQWGYYRYGVTYVLPSKANTGTSRYKALRASMNAVFKDLCGKDYEAYSTGIKTVVYITSTLASTSPSAEEYNFKMRPELALLFDGVFGEPQSEKKAIAALGALGVFNLDLVKYLILNFGLINLTDELGLSDSINDISKGSIAHGHTQETYIAWMKSSDASIFEGHSYRGVNISCPVDVKVYDSSNNLVCSIVNDVVDTKVMENGLAAEVENGTKSIDVPEGEQYRFEITATDSGTMDISCTSYEPEGEATEQLGFDNLPLEVGKTYTLLSNAADSEQPSQDLGDLVALSSPEGATISSDYSVAGDEIGSLSINVTVEGEGEVAYPRTATRGDRVTLQAAPADGYAFDGWYSAEGAKLSSNTAYTFRCDTSSEFTAVFTHIHTWDSGVVTTEPTYTSEGVKTYTCTGCQATKTEPIAKLNPPSFGGGGSVPVTPQPDPTPTPDPEPEPTPVPDEPVRMDTGATFEIGNISFMVLADNKTVSVKAASGSFNGKTLTIPAVVKDANGFEYQVTEVAANAFKNCTSIKQVVISEGVKVIGAYAFKGCTKLEKVTLPKSLTTIERSVFSGCKKLTKLTIPANVKSIGKYAFYKSGIKTLTIKSTKLTQKSLSPKALAGSNIKTIKVPNSKLKAYKKLFTKSGCGKTVTLREL